MNNSYSSDSGIITTGGDEQRSMCPSFKFTGDRGFDRSLARSRHNCVVSIPVHSQNEVVCEGIMWALWGMSLMGPGLAPALAPADQGAPPAPVSTPPAACLSLFFLAFFCIEDATLGMIAPCILRAAPCASTARTLVVRHALAVQGSKPNSEPKLMTP